MKYTKEILKQKLLDFVEIYNRNPTGRDCKKYPEILVGRNTFVRYFGSFNSAILYAGLIPYTREVRDYKTISCEFCNIEFIDKTCEAKFCSKSCYNSSRKDQAKNSIPDRVIKVCLECSCPFESDKKSRKGDFCNFICRSTNQMKNISIGEMSRYTEQNKYRAIRDKAHNFYNTFGKSCSCANCGYSKHVELCHIKAITDFDKSESVWECNKPENIIFLCPNCHWELDYGDLSVEDIRVCHLS